MYYLNILCYLNTNRYREEAQQDIDSSSELVEELSRQTDELRRQKNETLPRASVTEQVNI